MLSCKTDSAKLKQSGGPVSSSSISIAARIGGPKTGVACSGNAINLMGELAVTHFATIARTSLQQGVFASGFFFAGAECIGQPLISDSGDAVDSAIDPSAQ
jgi:hypothetical protein